MEHVGGIPESKLDSNDGILTFYIDYHFSTCYHYLVFICDTGKECFVWIGRGASDAENKNAFSYAHVRKSVIFVDSTLFLVILGLPPDN